MEMLPAVVPKIKITYEIHFGHSFVNINGDKPFTFTTSIQRGQCDYYKLSDGTLIPVSQEQNNDN